MDVSAVQIRDDTPTGAAFILVDATGENVIVVSPGGNGQVDAGQVEALPEALIAATVTVMQLEIPLDTVSACARDVAGTVVLNPAPAHPDAADLLEHVDVVIPNEHELLALAGRADGQGDDGAIERAATKLSRRLPCIVTLGARGALVAQDGHVMHIPAFPTAVVDTTGAGDAFCAGVAVALATGVDVYGAAGQGAAAGALAVRALGAQTGLPTRAELLELLKARTG